MAGESIRRCALAAAAVAFAPPALAAGGPDPQNLIWFCLGLGVIALVLALLLVRQQRRSKALTQGLEERARTAESRAALCDAEIDKLRAEQLLLRGKLDSLGAERDSYRRLFNEAPIAAWRREASGDIIWRNAMLSRIVGPDTDNDEIASRTDQDKPLRLVEAARTERRMVSEERHFVVDGQRRTYTVYEAPPAADGFSAGFAIDMSAVQDARRELRRSIEANNGIFEQINTGVAVYDRDKRLIFSNKAYRVMWGLDAEFLGSEPNLSEMLEKLKELRKLPEQVEFRQFKEARESLFHTLIDPMEELYQRPDERMMRVAISRHGLGGLIFLFDDATDRISLERNLNTYIAVQRATLDNLHEAVAVFGPDGRLRLSNTQFHEMFELPEELIAAEPHAREIVDFVIENWDQPDAFTSIRDKLIASTTDPQPSASQIDLPDGRVINARAQMLPDTQKLFTYLDVTDSLRTQRALRERNEALITADRVKSEFLENMSYELRTPLSTIIGFAEILDKDYFGELNERQREYSIGIMEASEQFLSMINDMLDLASIQAGHMQVHRDMVDVTGILTSLDARFRVRAGRRQITVRLDLEPELPLIEGDPRRVEQVVSNLLSNAVKFTAPGGRIVLGASRIDGGIAIRVEDTGIGIPEEEQQHIFETFRTSERHTRRGTGLGLALVRNLVELHGGRLELESEVGKGTTVTVYLHDTMPDDVESQTLALDGTPLSVPAPEDQ